MECVKSKKLIYLFDELNDNEKLLLDQHMKTCENCRKLLIEVKSNRRFFQQVMSPPINTSEQLTDNIMNEVIKAKRETSVGRDPFPILNRLYVRFAFAAVSLLLLITFVTEFNQRLVVEHHKDIFTYRNSRTVRLNSSDFYNPSNRDSVNRPSLLSLANCIKACDQPALSKVCDECRTKFESTSDQKN